MQTSLWGEEKDDKNGCNKGSGIKKVMGKRDTAKVEITGLDE